MRSEASESRVRISSREISWAGPEIVDPIVSSFHDVVRDQGVPPGGPAGRSRIPQLRRLLEWPLMEATILSVLGVGFSLGLKHALDADHLAAVATMIGDRRRTVVSASLVGVAWGAG